MNVLIAGGAGFIGSWLCDYFIEKKHKVIAVDNFTTSKKSNIAHLLKNKNFKFKKTDITKKININERIDAVLNFASIASPIHYQKYKIETLLVGSQGTFNLLELARKNKAKYLFASTSEVYGDPQIHPQIEAYWGNVNPIGIRSCYDEGKRCAETLMMDYHRQHNIEIRIARIFNTYGPKMALNDGRVVSNFIVQALKNEPITPILIKKYN